MNLWDMASILVTGDKVVTAKPDSWEPLASPEILEYVNDHTLKVVDAGSFGSEGELVHFNRKDGHVETINYTGATMWPKEVWLKKHQQRMMGGQ